VGNQQHGKVADQPNGLPPLFAIYNPVRIRHVMRISKYELRRFKRDAVFAQIAPSLDRIPFKADCTFDL